MIVNALTEMHGMRSDFKGVETRLQIEHGSVQLRISRKQKTLIFVESRFDTFIYDLIHDGNYIVLSVTGVRTDGHYIKNALDAGYEVACGYDNNKNGGVYYAKKIKRLNRTAILAGITVLKWKMALSMKRNF